MWGTGKNTPSIEMNAYKSNSADQFNDQLAFKIKSPSQIFTALEV